jgi:hypothetical protein
MTDRDVIERVAIAFGTSVYCVDKRRYRTEYGARIKGSRAVSLMQDLRPIMSDRRRAAIDGALSAHSPPQRKLDFHSPRTFDGATKEAQPSLRWRACLMFHDRRFAPSCIAESIPTPHRLHGASRSTCHTSGYPHHGCLQRSLYGWPAGWKERGAFLRRRRHLPNCHGSLRILAIVTLCARFADSSE